MLDPSRPGHRVHEREDEYECMKLCRLVVFFRILRLSPSTSTALLFARSPTTTSTVSKAFCEYQRNPQHSISCPISHIQPLLPLSVRLAHTNEWCSESLLCFAGHFAGRSLTRGKCYWRSNYRHADH